MVLTQLGKFIPQSDYNWFPYHYGSYATKDRDGNLILDKGKFPYHYGSYATRKEPSRSRAEKKFPYHYGSYATLAMPDPLESTQPSFHTTMVLTQRESRRKDTRSVKWFPYHYGSYATKS